MTHGSRPCLTASAPWRTAARRRTATNRDPARERLRRKVISGSLRGNALGSGTFEAPRQSLPRAQRQVVENVLDISDVDSFLLGDDFGVLASKKALRPLATLARGETFEGVPS